MPNQLLSDADVRHIHAAVRKKCLDAIAAGNLPPGRELELISALDLGTVPWSLLPIKLKEQLSLPLEDKGIDSLSLNLTVAVQAKDYSGGKAVPLNRLTNFHFMVEAKGSPLKKHVQQLIVATNCNTTLPQQWQWSEAVHRPYAPEEIEEWRERARMAQQEDDEEAAKVPKQTLERWPHQVECLKKCRKFLKNKVKRDFFVQMATGSGKSLVMADLLASLGSGRRSCIIVPKLDLMEQLAQLLQEMLPSRIARVGTGWPADFTADIFVCVRNSAWQLSNVTFDLLILDEAHHYEPQPGSRVDTSTLGIHAQQVLSLKAPKRIFFTATLLKNKPNFDFNLRCAITAGIIKDYAVMVPVLSEGDPRPGLIEIIQNLPFSRKILAFCNTVCEAKYFTKMLCAAGIPADHYNGFTSRVQRQDILTSFQRSEMHGGIRVLVTVDVLSEGVDLPVADTCLFVAPRRGVRLQQCVGRVLRNHSEKVDALVVAPPVVQQANGTMVEDEELGRLLAELALADSKFQSSLEASDMTSSRRVGVLGRAGVYPAAEVLDDVAHILRVCVFPRVLGQIHSGPGGWETGFQALAAYKAENGHVMVPQVHVDVNGFQLGSWVKRQRAAAKLGRLSGQRKQQLVKLGFVWDVLVYLWEVSFQRLQQYKAEHGHVLVPNAYKTADGFHLGRWVNNQRTAEKTGKLPLGRENRLEEVGFVWDVGPQPWEENFQRLLAYRAKHGNVLVPQGYKTADGFRLGWWVSNQRAAKKTSKLPLDRQHRLEEVGFVWDLGPQPWEESFQSLRAYKAEHGNMLVPNAYKTADGFRLGRWVNNQRVAKKTGKLPLDRKHRLEEVGFVWDLGPQPWEESFQSLRAYKAKHRNVLVPFGYKTADGFRLGRWVSSQRAAKKTGKLPLDREHRLEEVGFVWGVGPEPWEESFQRLLAYGAKHGNMLVPQGYKTADGFRLGRWVSKQRTAKKRGQLPLGRENRLEEVGFVWDVGPQPWEVSFQSLRAYKAEHGNVLVPIAYKTADGFRLGRWVNNQRTAKKTGKLPLDRKHRLEEVGFVWVGKMLKALQGGSEAKM